MINEMERQASLTEVFEDAKYRPDELVFHIWHVVIEHRHPLADDQLERHGILLQLEGPVLGFEMEEAIIEARECLKSERHAVLHPGASIVSMQCVGFLDNVRPATDSPTPSDE